MARSFIFVLLLCEFCERAFHRAGIEVEWRGQGLEERGIDQATGRVLVEVDPRYLRPTEVEHRDKDRSCKGCCVNPAANRYQCA